MRELPGRGAKKALLRGPIHAATEPTRMSDGNFLQNSGVLQTNRAALTRERETIGYQHASRCRQARALPGRGRVSGGLGNQDTQRSGRLAMNRNALIVQAVVAASALFASTAQAVPIQYSARAAFESAISNELTDTFNSPAYGFINDSATMEALSVASINYSSTGWTQLNVVVSGTLCWGCNGSGRIDLDSTTIGTGAGVFGFGLDILGHSPSLPYDAFVTFGDGSTQNFTLPLGGPSFFGVTSSALIKSVAFGPNGGSSTTSGSFQIDNVSIGNEGGTHVPEPGAALLALAGLGVAGQVRRKHRAG